MPYPAGESSAVNRCSSVAGPSRGEHSSQGIWTCRLGNTMISASRVGLILFAVIVFLVGLVSEQIASLRFDGPRK